MCLYIFLVRVFKVNIYPNVVSGVPIESQNGLGWKGLDQAAHVLVHAIGLQLQGIN